MWSWRYVCVWEKLCKKKKQAFDQSPEDLKVFILKLCARECMYSACLFVASKLSDCFCCGVTSGFDGLLEYCMMHSIFFFSFKTSGLFQSELLILL